MQRSNDHEEREDSVWVNFQENNCEVMFWLCTDLLMMSPLLAQVNPASDEGTAWQGPGCRHEAGHCKCCREEVRGSVGHGGARALHQRGLAEELEAEAATWVLLSHLYADANLRVPAGWGGPPLAGAGSAATTSQRAASEIASDPALNRCMPPPPPPSSSPSSCPSSFFFLPHEARGGVASGHAQERKDWEWKAVCLGPRASGKSLLHP